MADEDLNPLVYDQHGTASFDLDKAIRMHDQEQKEFANVAEDLARLGMGSLIRESGRAPAAPPPQKGKGVGDIHTQMTEPGQRYWERFRQGRAESIEKPVALFGVPQVKGRAQGPVIVQPHPHLAPQVSAINIDVFTGAAGVEVTGAYPGPGGCVELIRIDVPDRFIVVLDRFGNELEDHSAFGDVRFSMKRNRTPIRSYGNFDVQLGEFIRPTKFSSPIILKHKDRFVLQAQSLSGATHTAFARLTGWAFAVTEITGDGSYKEFETK